MKVSKHMFWLPCRKDLGDVHKCECTVQCVLPLGIRWFFYFSLQQILPLWKCSKNPLDKRFVDFRDILDVAVKRKIPMPLPSIKSLLFILFLISVLQRVGYHN
jgi:hypothetical protein